MNDEMQDILNDFLAESSEMLEALDQHFVKLKTDPTNAEPLNEIFRCMHSMKGSAGFLGFTRLVEVAHQGESLLNKLRQGEMSVSPFIIDIILEAVDAVKLLHTDIRETGEDSHVDTALIVNKLTLTMDSAKDLKDAMSSAPLVQSSSSSATGSLEEETTPSEVGDSETPALSSKILEEGEVMANPHVAPELSTPMANSAPALSEVMSEMQRVASRSVQSASSESKKASGKEEDSTVGAEKKWANHIMKLVGELVLGRNRLLKLGFGLEKQYENSPLVRELGMTLGQLNLVTSDLQLAVRNTRMVPVGNVPLPFSGFVQDLSSKLGTQVRSDFMGEDTKVDKSAAKELGDPLVHLVGNSMGHDLESVKEPKRMKKIPEGSVRAALGLGQEGNSIIIRIEDDGRGFAVVADEIHKMVEQTTKATKAMGDMVRQIQQDVKSVVSSRDQGTNQVRQGVEKANKTGEALSKIQAMAKEMAVIIQQIAGVAEEQSNATQQIAGDLEAMTKTTRQTISGVAESAQSCHQLITLANDLQKTVGAFKV
jgi:two-component system chemotaxis sensor kinase CheA